VSFADPQEIVDYTGLDMEQFIILDQPFPLDMFRIKITGVDTALNKQDAKQNITEFATVAAQAPGGAMMTNWDEVIEEAARSYGLEEPDRFIVNDPMRMLMNIMIQASQSGMDPSMLMQSRQVQEAKQNQPPRPSSNDPRRNGINQQGTGPAFNQSANPTPGGGQ
jgi:hypothetical protein